MQLFSIFLRHHTLVSFSLYITGLILYTFFFFFLTKFKILFTTFQTLYYYLFVYFAANVNNVNNMNIGVVGFVISLKKGHYKYQFGMFAWCHLTILLVIFQSSFLVVNLLDGMIWSHNTQMKTINNKQ